MQAILEVTLKFDSVSQYGQYHLKAPEKEGCFVSTLVFNYLGKDDNCQELNTLRKFRDEYLLASSEGRVMVESYYRLAPSLMIIICLRCLIASRKATMMVLCSSTEKQWDILILCKEGLAKLRGSPINQ